MKIKLLILFALFLFVGAGFAQTSGGPDNYGYTWKNEGDPTGPSYNWKNIKGIGTQITGFADDNEKGPFNLNWNFHYYWSNYSKIWVGSNGWVAFQDIGNIAAPFPAIPTSTAPNNYLAPMASDLTFTQTNASAVSGATAWYWTNNTDSLIVQFDSVPYWVNSGSGFSGRYTFQVILNGNDSSITYQYEHAQSGTAYSMSTEGLKTGIENSTGQIGLQILNNVFPAANTAVKFYYPNPVTYQVVDATPSWNQNTTNGGFFVTPGGNPINLKTNIFNAGNQPLNNITATGELFDFNMNLVWDTSMTISSLAAGAETMFNYPETYSATTAGTYTYRSTTSVTGDINPENNETNVEMVVVDTTQTTIPLSYVTATAPASANSWGGNGGQGIYIEPPYYPATISSLDFMVGQTGPTGYHLVQILDDNGPGRSPGTVLYLDSLAASATTAGAYNNVPVTTPLTIDSGGVYVAWLENGDTLSSIGVDAGAPYSNRNFEVIGGSWSTYRSNAENDLMIRVIIDNTVGVNNLSSNFFTLEQNYPNPASSSTTINYSLLKNADTRLVVRNMLGEEVSAMDFGRQMSGNHSIRVNTGKFAPGIYFYTLRFNDQEITKKMLISK